MEVPASNVRAYGVQDILSQNGIKLPSTALGEHSTTCPKCSAKRQRHHQTTKCLGVKIDARGVCWRCNHCGWTGPEKGSAKSNGQGGEFVATYDYNGFQKVRYPKGHDPRFRIRHREGGGWKWGAGGADTNVLYRKDAIDEAIAVGHTILVVEGEKDVERLQLIGIPATCNSQGASEPDKKPKWKAEHSAQLVGADIVVIPDHDAAGYAHCDAACRLSLGVAKRVRRLVLAEHWPDCPKGRRYQRLAGRRPHARGTRRADRGSAGLSRRRFAAAIGAPQGRPAQGAERHGAKRHAIRADQIRGPRLYRGGPNSTRR